MRGTGPLAADLGQPQRRPKDALDPLEPDPHARVGGLVARGAADRMQLLLRGASEVVAASLAAEAALSADEGDDGEGQSVAG